MEKVTAKTKYEKDFALWIEETVSNLRNKNFKALDLKNLIEEVESLGKNEQRSLKSFIRQILVHKFKLKYVADPYNIGHWNEEIANFQAEMETLLEDSPSLKTKLPEYLEDQYPKAIRQFNKKYPQYKVEKEFTIADIVE
ncbi:MAG: DUF29 domain-containing protein [Xenococcaceae cyanobacterium MO_207.B15]|nr:DUF29 domain-containing protein [Xenococcaceae cyanobacterium MO_207.B15]MDJ0744087.1 DUF29 domain-containing protein [Xenococcaceae cyanobacterium MO_167.B27]